MVYIKRMIAGPIGAAFIISAGWQWYHFPHNPHGRIIVYTLALWLGILVVYKLFNIFYKWLVVKSERHPYWQEEFVFYLDDLFFIFSLYFLVFFSRNELLSLGIFSLVSALLFFRSDKFLSRHPSGSWRTAMRAMFVLAGFIFIVQSFFQYFAFSHYILDSNIKYYNIVLFRAVAMGALWLAGFAAASMLYVALAGRTRFAFVIVWVALFIASLFIGIANIGVLYQSSLYLSPEVVAHAGGSGMRVFAVTGAVLVGLFVALSTVAMIIISGFFRAHRLTERHVWYFYDMAIIALALMSFFTVASLQSTPEAKIAKSFYDYWRGADPKATLEPVVQRKLERFGLAPNLNDFYVNDRESVFTTTTKLLPEKFNGKKPNVIIVFLESFSSRLTGPYNETMKEVTPGLNNMSATTGTTKFKNVYSASTPTITGLISELCSFLPPTGHNEIETEKHLQSHHLYCLPNAMLNNGYKSTMYITAVEKDYANKDSILASMGVKETWGTKELSERITGEPMAWGYSDHQMFPVMFDEMKVRRLTGQEPFLIMLSTVDTHPPFNLVKDEIKYGNGENLLLNTIHTTDDAFGKFWAQFKASEFYNDTIVIAIADHAIFATAYEKQFFPELYGKMTYYDEMTFMTYIPESILPKEVDTFASGIDFAPTVMQILGLNGPNSFEGHSIFDDRSGYPNLLGMHEFGLWINQMTGTSSRQVDYAPPMDLRCGKEDIGKDPSAPLTLCEYFNYYEWKRLMFEQGRMWFGKK